MDSALKRWRWLRTWSLLLIVAALVVVHVLDPFGYGRVTGALSEDLVQRALAPWYPAAVAEPGAVMLFSRAGSTIAAGAPFGIPPPPHAEWPPSYTAQWRALHNLFLFCPAAVVLDVGYDSRRSQAFDFTTFLALVLDARRRAACKGELPALIFADDFDERVPQFAALRRLASGAWPVEETVEIADAAYRENEPPLVAAGGEANEIGHAAAPSVLDDTEPNVALALASWPERDVRPGSPDLGRASHRFYFLLGFDRAASGTPADDTGRASLALAAYLAFCRAGGACSPCIGEHCRPDIYGLAGRFFADNLSLTPVEEEAAESFRRPLDLRWRRWSPAANDVFFADDVGASVAARPCHPPSPPNLWTYLGEALASTARAFPGADPNSESAARARCYPVPVFTTDQLASAAMWRENAARAASLAIAERPDEALHDQVIALAKDRRTLAANLARVIRNKVVFIGFEDRPTADIITSPVHGRVPGVVYHAMAFDNLTRWNLDYGRPPPVVHAFALPLVEAPIPLSADVLLEVVLLAALSWIVVEVMDRFNRAKAPSRFWSGVNRAIEGDGYPRLRAGCGLALVVGVVASGTALLAGATLAVSLGLSILAHVVFDWSLLNWIGIGLLSPVPALLVARSHTGLGPPSNPEMRKE